MATATITSSSSPWVLMFLIAEEQAPFYMLKEKNDTFKL